MDKTFITGVDSNHEFLLPLWLKNIREHDKETHITIADFGMSEEFKKWSKENSDHFLEYEKPQNCSWFLKPKTMIDAPYEYKCWIDVDCEVLTNISEIFDFVSGDDMALTEDPFRAKEIPGEKWMATGVNVVKGIPKILKHWNEICQDTKRRGDQEVLHDILKYESWRAFITIMPIEYQWLRLHIARGMENPNAKIIHWTGEKGKNILKNKILNDF